VAVAGRDPDQLEIIPFLGGTTVHEETDALERAGATEIAFDLHPADGQTVRGVLDRIAGFIDERRGAATAR
jgi:hypothetical protein